MATIMLVMSVLLLLEVTQWLASMWFVDFSLLLKDAFWKVFFVWTLASASVVDEIHVKVLFPPICVIWVSCCAGQLHQSWSIFWGYILPLVLWSLCMDLASTSCLSSFRLVIHFLDVFCKWTFPSVPPNTFCCILYISSSLFDPCMWTPDYTMELPWWELKLPTWLLCNVVFTFLIAGIAKGGKFSIFSGTNSGQCGVNCFLQRWKIWGFNCEGLHLSPDLWVKPRISAEITELQNQCWDVKTSKIFLSIFGGMLTKCNLPWGILENEVPAGMGILFSKMPLIIFSLWYLPVSWEKNRINF